MRLVSVAPDLRLIIETMLRSIPSMGHVVVLLSLVVYVYAILGFNMYHASDPAHWGTLGKALLSVFQLLTLEGWVEMQQALEPRHRWAWLYFGSFIMVGVFIIINLFIAVVLNNLETVKAEQDRGSVGHEDLLRQVEELKAQLEAFEAALRSRQALLRDVTDAPGVPAP